MTDQLAVRESAEQLLSDGLSKMRQAYYSDVREYAQELRQAIVDGEIEDRESLMERVSEMVDGTQWVVYTFKAQCVLMASDNDDAYAEDFGEEGMVKDGAINWSGMAFAAMERDLYEQLEAEGVNVNGDSKAEMLGEEEGQ